MKVVIGGFMFDVDQYHGTAGQANGEPCVIQKIVLFVLAQVPEGKAKEIEKHSRCIMVMGLAFSSVQQLKVDELCAIAKK